MKKITKILCGVAVLLLAAGCGTKKLEEKLNAEYSMTKGEWKRAFVEVEAYVEKHKKMRVVHDEEDLTVDKAPLSQEDRATQTRHKAWFAEYEKTLTAIEAWMDSVRTMETRHSELEMTHEKAGAAQIKKDHALMLEEIGQAMERTEEYDAKIRTADSTINAFFVDHARIAEKYGLKSLIAQKPPREKVK